MELIIDLTVDYASPGTPGSLTVWQMTRYQESRSLSRHRGLLPAAIPVAEATPEREITARRSFKWQADGFITVATIAGMVNGRNRSVPQLRAMAGPLGWTFEDLIAVAGQPVGSATVKGTLCRHVGNVYVAAIPLTSEQLFQAAVEADRLSRRQDHGAWRPWNWEADPCPDDGGPSRGD